MQITSSPATLAVSVNHDNFTNGCIAKTGKFAVSILPENTDPVLIGAFGFQSGKDKDKFAGVDYELAEGIPVVKASMGYMVCKVISTMETSTHTVFLGEVIACLLYTSLLFLEDVADQRLSGAFVIQLGKGIFFGLVLEFQFPLFFPVDVLQVGQSLDIS